MLLCNNCEIILNLCSPFPPTAVATTIVVVLLCLRLPFPPTTVSTTIVVIPSAVVVIHPVSTFL